MKGYDDNQKSLYLHSQLRKAIDVARGAERPFPLKFLENIVIFCFENRFFKENGAIRLKSYILAPPEILGWLSHCVEQTWASEGFFQGGEQ